MMIPFRKKNTLLAYRSQGGGDHLINPSAMTCQAIRQQFRQCLSVMDNLSQEGFTVSQFTVDGYSRPTITLRHDRQCDALHKKGHAVRYALGTDRQGRWEKYQFLQDNCRITWEVR